MQTGPAGVNPAAPRIFAIFSVCSHGERRILTLMHPVKKGRYCYRPFCHDGKRKRCLLLALEGSQLVLQARRLWTMINLSQGSIDRRVGFNRLA